MALPVPGALPVRLRALDDGRTELEGTDPRFMRGPTGQLTGVNYLHDVFLAQNPGARDVGFEGDPASGRFRITAPEARLAALYGLGLAPGAAVAPAVGAQGVGEPPVVQNPYPAPGALDLAAVDPVLAYGYKPGWGVHNGTQAGGYLDPTTGQFYFLPQGAPGGAPLLTIPGAERLTSPMFQAQLRYYYGGPEGAPTLYSYVPPPPQPAQPEVTMQATERKPRPRQGPPPQLVNVAPGLPPPIYGEVSRSDAYGYDWGGNADFGGGSIDSGDVGREADPGGYL